MIPAAVLSGNLVIHTQFYDADFLLGQATVRAFYDGIMGEADQALGAATAAAAAAAPDAEN